MIMAPGLVTMQQTKHILWKNQNLQILPAAPMETNAEQHSMAEPPPDKRIRPTAGDEAEEEEGELGDEGGAGREMGDVFAASLSSLQVQHPKTARLPQKS